MPILHKSAISLFLLCFFTFANLFPSSVAKGDGVSQGILKYKNLDPVATAKQAIDNVNKYIDTKSQPIIEPVLHISPKMGDRNYSLYLNGLNRVSRLWSDFISPEKLNIVLFTELDGEWVDDKQRELTGEWAKYDELQSERLKKYGCNIGGMYLPGVLFFCVSPGFEFADGLKSFGDAHKFAHEYTHYFEMNLKNWVAHAKGSGIGKRNTCWIEEGFATFYGVAVGAAPLDPSGELKRKFFRQLTFAYDKNRGDRPGTLADLIEVGNIELTKTVMHMLENTPFPCDETENAYAFGAMTAEMLVAVNGQEGMNNFYKTSAETGDWRLSLQKAFGITAEELYEVAAEYFASQFNESNFLVESPKPETSALPKPEPTPVVSSLPTDSIPVVASPSTVEKSKVITIKCFKGATVKKVKGIKPKCPKGFKKR